MAENRTTEVKGAETSPEVGYIEIYDIFLTDGTHLRYCTSSNNEQLLDQSDN